jgi:hypothetical protein
MDWKTDLCETMRSTLITDSSPARPAEGLIKILPSGSLIPQNNRKTATSLFRCPKSLKFWLKQSIQSIIVPHF